MNATGATSAASNRVAFVLKGYPRLSETFIAQEIEALEARGLDILIVSLRHPSDKAVHPVHQKIRAKCVYLPEYLYQEPGRLWRGWRRVRRRQGYAEAWRIWRADLSRDRTPNRIRRFGQAIVLAAELPAEIRQLHAHFLHTPASVARYAAAMLGIEWTVSAHAKDVWTTPDWETREKLASAGSAVTCTAAAHAHLTALAPHPERVLLCYHGLALDRFPAPPVRSNGPDGSDAGKPVVILSVGRLVEKKGYDDLLAALARLPAGLAWRFVHIGGGPLSDGLKAEAQRLGLADRQEWRGAQAQPEVLAAYRGADLFVLAAKAAKDGDQDGLPNVLLEALSQGLACVATDLSGIPELIDNDRTGVLVPSADPAALSAAIAALIADPPRRARLGHAGEERVRRDFDSTRGIDLLASRFGLGIVAPSHIEEPVIKEPVAAGPAVDPVRQPVVASLRIAEALRAPPSIPDAPVSDAPVSDVPATEATEMPAAVAEASSAPPPAEEPLLTAAHPAVARAPPPTHGRGAWAAIVSGTAGLRVRIACYAPLKPPDHPVPSGDRHVARLFMAAWRRAGHTPVLVSRLRSFDPTGDRNRQMRLARLGGTVAARLIRRWHACPEEAPHAWFTYHLYYKAPDWLGPTVSRALGIPYIVAEASHAPKRASGPWAVGHAAMADAVGRANAVIGINSADRGGIVALMEGMDRWVAMPPFLDAGVYTAPERDPAAAPRLIAVAMMRHGDKLASYRLLGLSVARLLDLPWTLEVVGDGPARAEVAEVLAPIAARVHYAGALAAEAVAARLAAADLCVWPAINEAFGMALLEAQAAGLPVVAGASGGVADVVADGDTGLLVPPNDVDAFARATRLLVSEPEIRLRMGRAARAKVLRMHDIDGAAARLGEVLTALRPARAA